MDEEWPDTIEPAKLSLWYDDDGNKLEIGDFVVVNGDTITMIDEDLDGDRYLKGIPDDLLIQSIEKQGLDLES